MKNGSHKRNKERNSSSNSRSIWFHYSLNLERYHSWYNDTCRTLACGWTNDMERCSDFNSRGSCYNCRICDRNCIYFKMGWHHTKVEITPLSSMIILEILGKRPFSGFSCCFHYLYQSHLI